MKDTQKSKLLAITGMAASPFVMPNVAADAEGHVISEDGLIALIEAVENGEAAQAALAETQTRYDALAATIDADATALTIAQTALQIANNEIVTLKEKVVKLEAEDGTNFSEANSTHDAEGNLKVEFLTGIDAEAAALTQ